MTKKSKIFVFFSWIMKIKQNDRGIGVGILQAILIILTYYKIEKFFDIVKFWQLFLKIFPVRNQSPLFYFWDMDKRQSSFICKWEEMVLTPDKGIFFRCIANLQNVPFFFIMRIKRVIEAYSASYPDHFDIRVYPVIYQLSGNTRRRT